MVRLVLTLLIGLFVLVDVAPAFAQSNGTVLMAQAEKRRTLFDLLFGAEEPVAASEQAAPKRTPTPAAAQATRVEKAADATRLAVSAIPWRSI